MSATKPSVSRRSFCRDSIVAASALATIPTNHSRSAAAAPSDPLGWIDAHVHVWSPDTATYPISETFAISDMQPPSFTAGQLLEHCKPAGVTRVVLIQMSFYQFDHRYLFEVMKANPGTFSAVALVDHHQTDLVERIESLVGQGVRGIRLHSSGDAKSWSNDPGMATLWRTAAEKGIAVCPLINPAEIPFVDSLCERFPETTVVVDHFARIGVSGMIDESSMQSLCRLARFPNTHVKTSAFYALGKKTAPYEDLLPMIRRVTDCFGPQRLMWGSDCPYQVQGDHNYKSSISLIRDRADFLSETDKNWILRDTANQVFF